MGPVQYSLKKLTRPKEEFSTWKTYSDRGIVKKNPNEKLGRARVIYFQRMEVVLSRNWDELISKNHWSLRFKLSHVQVKAPRIYF